MKYHLRPVRRAVSSARQETTNTGVSVEKSNPCALLVGSHNGGAMVESSMEGPQKVRIIICISSSLLGIYTKETKY